MVKEKFYKVSEAAKELGYHPVYVRLLCEKGVIHGVKNNPNGHWRISLRELRHYKEQKEAQLWK